MNARRLHALFAIIMVVSAVGTARAATVDPLTNSAITAPALGPGDTGLIPITAVSPGSLVDQDWFFSLTSPSKLKGDVISFNFDSFHIKDLMVELLDTATDKMYDLGAGKFSLASLPAGPYELILTGDATGSSGGIYAGAFHLTAVPLPAAAWLLLSGLVGLGAIARRRTVDTLA